MGDERLSDQAYEHIYRRIVSRELLPGDIVDRRELTSSLGLSMSPVVQALARLEMEGFLEILPRKVTRVRMIRREDFRGQMLLRNALECQAARVYCGQPVEDNEARLRGPARRADARQEGGKIDWSAEIAFHRALVKLADCPPFLKEYDRVMRVGHFVLVSTFEQPNPFPPDPSGRWHADLVQALQTSDPDAAEHALRAHLEAGREGYLKS